MEKPEAVPQKASRADRVRSWLVALGPYVGAVLELLHRRQPPRAVRVTSPSRSRW